MSQVISAGNPGCRLTRPFWRRGRAAFAGFVLIVANRELELDPPQGGWRSGFVNSPGWSVSRVGRVGSGASELGLQDVGTSKEGVMFGQTQIDFEQLTTALDYLLSWVGLGCLVGLIVSGFVTGRQGGGSISLVVIAIVGTLLGCGMLQYLDPGTEIRPLSQQGLFVGVTGALVLVAFFGMLGGFYVRKEIEPSRKTRRRKLHRYHLQED